MKTITVEVWDFGTGSVSHVRTWNVNPTDSKAVEVVKAQACALFDGLVASDTSTDHVAYLREED